MRGCSDGDCTAMTEIVGRGKRENTREHEVVARLTGDVSPGVRGGEQGQERHAEGRQQSNLEHARCNRIGKWLMSQRFAYAGSMRREVLVKES